MLTRLGEKFTDFFRKNMPDAFVFALLLTLVIGIVAALGVQASPILIIESWYKGFWMLLEFGMQMVLLIVTGYTIALSPFIKKQIDRLTTVIKTPIQVYYFVTLFGVLVSMVSWGWVVIAAVLGRELAQRVKGVNYPFLIACAYFSNNSWVTGLSSSIPLLLNTDGNYLIESGVLEATIPTTTTLGSPLNISIILLYTIFAPLLVVLLRPKNATNATFKDLLTDTHSTDEISIEDEAESLRLPIRNLSDRLNNNFPLIVIIFLMGLFYTVSHFTQRGFDLNLNIMNFIFLILGLLLHKTPLRYSIAMRRTSSNVSSILFQFPFYAGIMGIMIHTGLGEALAMQLATIADIHTYPFFSFLLGGIVNFAIPSGGGEFAVIGPSILEAVNVIGSGLPNGQLIEMLSRASLAVAYGESLTNLLQPFYLLLVLPIMGAGIKIQARDVMGYLVIPFLLFFSIQVLLITFMPL